MTDIDYAAMSAALQEALAERDEARAAIARVEALCDAIDAELDALVPLAGDMPTRVTIRIRDALRGDG